MNNIETVKRSPRRSLIIAIIVVILIALCAIAFYIFSSGSSTKDDKKTDKNATEEQQTRTSEAPEALSADAVSADAAETTSSVNPAIANIPEPTLNPAIADATILESDPEPEVTRKQNQQKFNDCMESEDYAGAKAVLDSYFATSKFALSGEESFSNFTYYYEKQGLYEESIRYQLDFLEQHMGLDNIIEANTRYAHLANLLNYITIDDPRIQKIQESVNRWKEIQQLLDDNKVDTCLSKMKSYMQQGIDGVYAYHFLAQAYQAKPDYLSEAKTYYIFLLKMQEKEPTILEESYSVLFQQNLNALYDSGKITEENKNFLEDEITSANTPY